VNVSEAVQEVKERGFDDLTEARILRWLNEAVGEIVDYAPWPFNEATQEGTAPLTVSELGHVLSVSNKNTETPLKPIDRRQVVSIDPALVAKGLGQMWYREGETTIATFPKDTTSTFIVRYAKAPATLAGEETLPGPARFHDLYIDGTVVRAYKNRDNFEAAEFVRKEWERGLRQMVQALLDPNYDGPHVARRTGYRMDYIY